MPNPKEAALPIHDMASRHPGLTEFTAGNWLEGARVSLDRHHEPPATFTLTRDEAHSPVRVSWTPADEATRAAWANQLDASEAGAYSCALAAVELETGMVAIFRAPHESGADYFVAPPGAPLDDSSQWVRVEIAGRSTASPAALARLIADKLEQLGNASRTTPGLACVIGFGASSIRLADLELD